MSGFSVSNTTYKKEKGETTEWEDILIKKGIIPDPATIDPSTGLPFAPENAGGDLGAPVMEPEIDGSATEAPEMPNGGEI